MKRNVGIRIVLSNNASNKMSSFVCGFSAGRRFKNGLRFQFKQCFKTQSSVHSSLSARSDLFEEWRVFFFQRLFGLRDQAVLTEFILRTLLNEAPHHSVFFHWILLFTLFDSPKEMGNTTGHLNPKRGFKLAES